MSVSRNQASGAYRRWELPAFDGRAGDAEDAAPLPEPEPPPPAPPEPAPPPPPEPLQPMFKLPTADEIETMFEQAREEGYAAGYAEGVARAREEAERLAGIAQDWDESLQRLDGEVAEEVVALAIEVARSLVRRTLADHPAAVAEVVKSALQQLPQTQIRIHLHPDDVALVREYLAEQVEHGNHRIVEDDGVTRGGCRLDGTGSEVDATLETRWRRVLEGLGRKDTAWREDD